MTTSTTLTVFREGTPRHPDTNSHTACAISCSNCSINETVALDYSQASKQTLDHFLKL